MGILGWIVVGFVAGVLAAGVTGGRDRWNIGCLGHDRRRRASAG